MDKNKAMYVSKSIKKSLTICTQIPSFSTLSDEEIEMRLEELDHLCNHDGVVLSIIEHKHHESLHSIIGLVRVNIQRKIITLLSKIIKSAGDFNKSFISNLVVTICNIMYKETDSFLHEVSLAFITDIFKDSFKNILSEEIQKTLLNCFIELIKWNNHNVVYYTLCLLNIKAYDDSIVSTFLLYNVNMLAARLKTGTITEKLGNLICQLFLKHLDNIERKSSKISILDSNFDEVLIKILFQSHLTISADYYLIVINLLSEFLFLKYDKNNPEQIANFNDTITLYQDAIFLFLLETLRRYNVLEISIFGLKIFYVTLKFSKTIHNVLHESDQESWINFILEILRNNLSCADVIIWSSRVLRQIIALNANLILMLENRTNTNDIAIDSVIIQIFYTTKILTPEAFCASCKLLTLLATCSEKIQNRFLESQTHTFINMLVNKFMNSASVDQDLKVEIRKTSANAFRSLVLFSLSAKELFFNEDSQYQEAKKFIMNVTVHKRQCGLFEEAIVTNILFLASLAQYDPIKYDLMQAELLDIKHLLNCEVCSKNPSIIESIQELLIVFSGSESEIECLLEICSIENWCNLANKFPNIYSIQKNVMVFLQLNSLQIEKVKHQTTLGIIAAFIARATMFFDKSLVIKFEASVLIQILIKQYPEFAKICINNDLDLFLFEIISMNTNEDLVMVALQAFYVLSESNEMREFTLRKSVDKANLKLLQCMIDIGSDLSNISNELLLSAAKQSDESLSYSMISQLLNTGSRPTRYIINRCFEINNYSGASLLLRYYGIHESDKGHFINWSDLGMKHFQVSWIAKLYQELDVEIDRDVKWLSKRIKQESKNRLLLRKHYEEWQKNRNKLFRYPTTRTRSLEKKIGGYHYYTLNVDPIVSKLPQIDHKLDKYNSLNKKKLALLEINRGYSLPMSHLEMHEMETFHDEMANKSGNYSGNPSAETNNKFLYKVTSAELNEFIIGFQSRSDYSFHPLDPRCLLKDVVKTQRESKLKVCHPNILYPDLNHYVKISSSKNPEIVRSRDTFSDVNSETKDDIGQVCHLDLSKNKLNDLKEFGDIPKDQKLMSLFKHITNLKLDKNSIKTITVSTFQVMESLEHLNLSDNELTEIPWHVFKYCPLVHFNLSRNKIKQFFLPFDAAEHLKSYGKTKYLLQLLLSDNCFIQFNIATLGNFCNLQLLEINKISITISKDDVLPLSNLKKINMKYNTLSSINENFLSLSKNINLINLSENQLKPIDNNMEINFAQFENLVSINLSHNNLACGKPFFIPKCILRIPKLQTLDLSYNSIVEFPPCAMWTSKCLTELNFSHNLIQAFDLLNAKTSFQNLQILDLSHNHLRRIPPDIGYLNKLTCLNISHNENLKTLPDEIGLLKDKNLNSLIREGLTLNFPKYFNNKTHLRDILKYYYNRLRKSVEYNGLKVMVLGFSGRGKTSLLNALQGNKKINNHELNTIGLEVSNWKVQNHQLDKMGEFKFTCWDMAGNEDFICIQECFLSRKALYILVFDITKEKEEIRMLKPWLWSLKSQAPLAPLILVGTHLDKIRENVRLSQCDFLKTRITKLCLTPGFPKISELNIAFVDARKPNGTITDLKNKILSVLNKHCVHNETMIQEKQPSCYLKLDEILQETLKSLPPAYPILTEKELKELVSKNKLDLDKDELKQAIQFLHDYGILVHFNDFKKNLNDLYFVKPQWLCSMMSKIINLQTLNTFMSNGIIKLADFLQLFKDTLNNSLPSHVNLENHTQQCFRILKRFDIVFKRSSTEIIIPSRLPKQRPNSFVISSDVSKITRIFEFTFLPAGFWPRLIARISVLAKSNDQWLKLSKRELTFWRTGVIISFENSIYLVMEGKRIAEHDTEIIEISVTKSELGIKILVQIVDCIEVLIDEWYPGLIDIDFNGNHSMTSYALCPDCNSKIYLLDIVQQSQDSDHIICTQCSEMSGGTKQLPIRIIAPEIVLGDLPDHLIIKPDLLEVSKTPENLIGSGGNGSVYKGLYMGIDCAVKYINTAPIDYSNDPPSYRLLRQEIEVLRKLQHPSLVKLLGVDRERIILELAPLRDLKFILSNYIFPRRLLQRIAYQVISGIEYLHCKKILYRDVKMQNVLVFSIELSASINIKLADYGIAREIAPFGFINPQGTYGYQAPEVKARSESYTLSADIFSVGILLYNIATRGHHPAEMKTYWRAGKQPELISVYRCDNWPRMQDCINKCTKLVPQDRPKANEIAKFISCASFIAIKNVWPLTKQTRVECMVAKFNENKRIEVFLANGNQFIQEVRWLDVSSGQAKGKPFSNNAKLNRILSMLWIDEMLILGTQNGQLCVYDYVENKFIFTQAHFEDAILCMIMISINDAGQTLMLGLANGFIRYITDFTSIMFQRIEANEFAKIHLTDAPVCNLHVSQDNIFATCGSGIYTVIFSDKHQRYNVRKIMELDENPREKLIKCFCIVSENVNGIFTSSFYFTIRNESFIYNHDDQGNQLKPAIDCKELIRSKTNVNETSYSTRIMSLAIWSGDRYIGAGTGTGHLIIIDQKMDYIKIFALFRNPIVCMLHAKTEHFSTKSEREKEVLRMNSNHSILDSIAATEELSRASNKNSSLIIVGNNYKTLKGEDFDGAALIQLSDDLSTISRQLDKHINSRNDTV